MVKSLFCFLLFNSISTSSLVAPTVLVQKLEPNLNIRSNNQQNNFGTTNLQFFNNTGSNPWNVYNYNNGPISEDQFFHDINNIISQMNNECNKSQKYILKNCDMTDLNAAIGNNLNFNMKIKLSSDHIGYGNPEGDVGNIGTYYYDKNNKKIYVGTYYGSWGNFNAGNHATGYHVTIRMYNNSGGVFKSYTYSDNSGDIHGPLYFEIENQNTNTFSNPISNDGRLNFDFKLGKYTVNGLEGTKVSTNWTVDSNSTKKIRNATDIKLSFYLDASLNLPYNINVITKNLKNLLDGTKNYSNQWMENIGPIAETLNNQALELIPDYLKDAIKLTYNVNLANNTINWHCSYETMDNKSFNVDWKTTIQLATRPNLQQIYNALKTYLETPIILESNTSKNYKSSTVPAYIKNKFDEAKAGNPYYSLPDVVSYISSKANPNEFGKIGSKVNYYQGNYFGDTTDYYRTHDLIPNTEIITNYIRVLMTNFWNEYGYAFVDDPTLTDNLPKASIVFTNDDSGNPIIRIRFTFDNPPAQTIHNQPSPWDFNIPITCQETDYCEAQGIADRLILQGQNVPVIGPNQQVTYEPLGEDNSGIQIGEPTATDGGIRLFYSQVSLMFNASDSQTQEVYVNGSPLPIINNTASTVLSAPNEDSESSEYEGFKSYFIEIKDSGNTAYSITVYIGQTSPKTNIAYYAWDPKKNPAQMDMITPTLENGNPNPNYNPNINEKTGTTTQILWIEQNSQCPMYIDPYNEKGENITYSTGYLACGQVINKGVKVQFDPNTSDVYRTGVRLENGQLIQSNNPTSLNNSFVSTIGQTTKINPNDATNPYFSYDGIWNYTAKSKFPLQTINLNQTGIYGQYFAMVNNDVNANTSLFTDQLNKIDSSQVVVKDFWDTYHGDNLINYLVNRIGYTEQQIKSMDYETILQYWNLYSTEGLDQAYGASTLSLNQKRIENLRIKSNDYNEIENQITEYAIGYLNSNFNLQYQSQFLIEYDPNDINKLIEAYNKKERSEMTVYIKSNPEQDYVVGQTRFTVINDPNAINLDEIDFGLIKMNNKTTDSEELKTEIISEVDETLNNYVTNLGYYAKSIEYGTDYSIDWANIDKLLISESKPSSGYAINFPIYALSSSEILIGHSNIRAKNSTEYDIAQMVNFKDLNIQNLYLNISRSDVGTIEQAKAVISNYIFAVINNAFMDYFGKHVEKASIRDQFVFDWKPIIYSNEYVVYPPSFNITWTINNYDDILNKLVENIDQNSFNNTITISVMATDSSLVSTGTALFTASNAKLNDPNPHVPNMPEDPTATVKPKGSSPKWWIIPIAVGGAFILGIIIWVIWYRLKSRRLTSQS